VIASLAGVVDEKGVDDAVIDVNGVGYRVHLSLRAIARLPLAGQRVKLRIRTVVREDALDLYGFTAPIEEELFLLLTSVSHVGPKMAMTVLSGMDAEELAHAIGHGEVARLTKLHGVGKKTAERLVVELRDKIGHLATTARAAAGAALAVVLAADGRRGDLVSALVNMGYKPAQAERAADLAEERAGRDAGLDALIREALRAARG
jgi:Holliday junction DNA helicase RuvA